jgi:hypothetical protein
MVLREIEQSGLVTSPQPLIRSKLNYSTGDMGIAVPSTFVSIGDLSSVKNALQVMYNYQVGDEPAVIIVLGLIANQESHHRRISRSWSSSSTTRIRYISHVDHDWYI